MKVAIIGGGPAGCAAAYTLQKNKVDFELFEAGDYFSQAGVEAAVNSGERAAKNLLRYRAQEF